MINVFKLFMLLCIAALLATCKDEQYKLQCDDSHVSTADFIDDSLKYKWVGKVHTLPLEHYNVHHWRANWRGLGSDTFYYAELNLNWSDLDDTFGHVQLFMRQPYGKLTMTAEEAYQLCAPHDILFSDYDFFLNIYGHNGNATVAYETTRDSTNSYFTITERSPIHISGGDSSATIKGVFCCTVYEHENPVPFTGNFSARVTLETD